MNPENVRIVLVGTTHPGNIGAAARAMKTMGFEQLTLVRPSLFPHAEATARASGADDILAKAQVVDSLDDALKGCALVVATSARRRQLACPSLDPRRCAAEVIVASRCSRVALVFGRERTGLTNEELDRCSFLVHIPTNPNYSSLNLAAAVQVLTYELGMSAQTAIAESVRSDCPPATADDMARFYAHLEQVMLETGFLNPANPRQLMRRLRRLFNRARLDQNEVNILRGLLSSVQGSKRRSPVA